MTKRPTYTARGWLYCAATGLLLMSPQFVQAQSPSADSSAARPATTAKKSNPLFSAVRRELSKLKGSKKPQPPSATRKKPGLLPVFGPSPSNRVGTTKRQTAVQPAHGNFAGKQRGVHSGRGRQPIQQTAGKQPARTKKPGLLDRLLGFDKPKSSTRRVTADQNVPQRSNGIPGLFPGFLKSKPKSTTRTRTTQPQQTASQPPALVVKRQPKAPRFDDLDNAFPEESEAEADASLDGDFAEPNVVEKKETPFTGLTLDDPQEFEKPIIKSASGTTEEAPALEPETTVESKTAPELPVETAEKPAEEPAQDSVDTKLQKLAERETQGGLKGFCPVSLRDRRDLIDSTADFSSKFEGKTYHFSSAESKASFDADPAKYAPVKGGNDVIVLAEGNVELEGTLDHAVWFKDRLYLFSSSATLETFVGSPTKYSGQTAKEVVTEEAADEDDQEEVGKDDTGSEEAADESETDAADDPFGEAAADAEVDDNE